MIERLSNHRFIKFWPLVLTPLSVLIGLWIYRSLLHENMSPRVGQVLWFTAHYSTPAIVALFVEMINRRITLIPFRTRQLSWLIALVAMTIPVHDHLVQIGALDWNVTPIFDNQHFPKFNQILLYQFLIVTTISSLFLIILTMPIPDSRKAKRSPRGELGNAKFMTLRQARLQFDEGGICLGEAYIPSKDKDLFGIKFNPANRHTWGQGGKRRLLRSDAKDASGHGLIFVGSGGFKTTGFAVPTALEWDGPLICFDPSIEIGPLVHQTRKVKGYKVISLNPAYAENNNFNALEWVLNSPQDIEENIGVIASWIIGPTSHLGGSGKYFAESAESLIRCVLADILFDEHIGPQKKTLAEMRTTLAQSSHELRDYLEAVSKTSESPFAASLATTLYDLASEQFSGIVGTAQTATAFLDVAKFGQLVSGNKFSLSELAKGKTDIFINVPLESLLATPAIGKIIMAAFLNSMMQSDGNFEKRTMVLVDEAFQLGKGFQPILKARDVGRKYGISLALLYQSVGQLVDNYGEEGRQAFFESAAYRIYSAVQDNRTARDLSEECGDYTGYTRNSSSSTRSNVFGIFGPDTYSSSKSMTRVPLMTSDEIKQMRQDEALVFTVGNPPLRCSRPIYFRRADMLKRTDKNRFHR